MGEEEEENVWPTATTRTADGQATTTQGRRATLWTECSRRRERTVAFRQKHTEFTDCGYYCMSLVPAQAPCPDSARH